MAQYDKRIGCIATAEQYEQLRMIARWHDWTLSDTLRQLIMREATHYSADGEVRSVVHVDRGEEDLFDNCLLLLSRVFGFGYDSPRWTPNASAGDIIDAVQAAVQEVDYLYSLGARVLNARYGLDMARQRRPLEQVAAMFGISNRQRVRQIESKALRYLRHPDRINPLRALIQMEE